MVARSRSMAGPDIPPGTLRFRNAAGINTIVGAAARPSLQATMLDTVGQRGMDNPATLSRLARSGGLLSGYNASSANRWTEALAYKVNYANLAIAHPTLPGRPSLAFAATDGTRRANPSQPSIRLPVSIGELRELPRMLLSKYRRNRKQSNSVVESEFGWAPMIDDIQKLFELPDLIQSRLRTLNRLRKGPMSRSRLVWNESSNTREGGTVTFNTSQVRVEGHSWLQSEQSIQVTTRWAPSRELPTLGDDEMARLARNLVLGLEPQQLVQSAWDLLPWSWMFDWFVNLGDFIEANTSVAASVQGPALVSTRRTTTRKASATSYSQPGFSMSSIRTVLHNWDRQMAPPARLAFSVPLLSHRQTLILSSIAFNVSR